MHQRHFSKKASTTKTELELHSCYLVLCQDTLKLPPAVQHRDLQQADVAVTLHMQLPTADPGTDGMLISLKALLLDAKSTVAIISADSFDSLGSILAAKTWPRGKGLQYGLSAAPVQDVSPGLLHAVLAACFRQMRIQCRFHSAEKAPGGKAF